MTTSKNYTVRELRRFLLDGNFTCIINGILYFSEDTRELLKNLENQNQLLEVKGGLFYFRNFDN